MKANNPYLLGLLSLCALASCSNEQLETDQLLSKPVSKPITFSAAEWQQEGQTRTAYTKHNNGASVQWTAGDAIGVFPFLDDNDNTPASRNQIDFIISEGTASASTCVFDGGSWALRDGWTYWAYYPFSYNNYNENQPSNGDRTIVFDYTSTLTQVGNDNMDHLAAQDYMVALPKQVSDKGSINFEMKHMSAILELDVKFPEGTAVNVNNIVLKKNDYSEDFHNFSRFTMLSDGEYSIDKYWAPSLSLNLKNAATQGNSLTAYFITQPTSSNEETWEVTVAAESNLYKGTFTPNASSIEAGNIYKLACNVAPVSTQEARLGSNMLNLEETNYVFTPEQSGYYIFSFNYSSYYNLDAFGSESVEVYYNDDWRRAYLLEKDKNYYFSAYNNYTGNSFEIAQIEKVGLGKTVNIPDNAYRVFVPECDGYYYLNYLGWANWYSTENLNTFVEGSDIYELKAGEQYLIRIESGSEITINKVEELNYGGGTTVSPYGGMYYVMAPANKWFSIETNVGYYEVKNIEEGTESYYCYSEEQPVLINFGSNGTYDIYVEINQVPYTLSVGETVIPETGTYFEFVIPEDGYYYINSPIIWISTYTFDSMVTCYDNNVCYYKKGAPVLCYIEENPDISEVTVNVGRYEILKEGNTSISAGKQYIFIADETDYYKVENDGAQLLHNWDRPQIADYILCEAGNPHVVNIYGSLSSINIVRYQETTIQLNETITKDGYYSFTPSQSGFYMPENYYGSSCYEAETNKWVDTYTDGIRYLEAGVKYTIKIEGLESVSGTTKIVKLVENDYQLLTPGESLPLSISNGRYQIVTYYPQVTGSYKCVLQNSEYITWLGYNTPVLVNDQVAQLAGGAQYACMVILSENTQAAITSVSTSEITADFDQTYTLPMGSVTHVTFTASTEGYYVISSSEHFNWTNGPYVFLNAGETAEFSYENTSGSDIQFKVTNPTEINSWNPTASNGAYFFSPMSTGTYQFKVTNGSPDTGCYYSVRDTRTNDFYQNSAINIGTNPMQLIPMDAGTQYLLYFEVWTVDDGNPQIKIELENNF